MLDLQKASEDLVDVAISSVYHSFKSWSCVFNSWLMLIPIPMRSTYAFQLREDLQTGREFCSLWLPTRHFESHGSLLFLICRAPNLLSTNEQQGIQYVHKALYHTDTNGTANRVLKTLSRNLICPL